MSAFLVGLITIVAVVSYAITRVGLAGLSISIIMQLIHFHDEEKYAEWSKNILGRIYNQFYLHFDYVNLLWFNVNARGIRSWQ